MPDFARTALGQGAEQHGSRPSDSGLFLDQGRLHLGLEVLGLTTRRHVVLECRHHEVGERHVVPDEVERRVALRMGRQNLLTSENSPCYWVIMDEAALRRPMGGRACTSRRSSG